jgi:hypothetical protein
MKHIPGEKQLEELLENVSLHASPRLDKGLSAAPWTPQAVARHRLINISVVTALLFSLFIIVLPQGRAFAQRIFLFFRTTEEQSFPIPTEQVFSLPPTETPVPTYILPLEPVEAVAATQTPQAPDRSCTSPEAQSEYFCQIKTVEAQAGFGAKELPYDPKGMKFSKATFNADLEAIEMEFVVITGGGYLYLRQGVGDFPSEDKSKWGKVPADAIEQVTVNGQYAELVLGTFIVYPNTTEAVWEPGGQLLLHWRENDRWFSLEKLGDPYPIEWIGKKEIVELAESIVDERPLNEVLPVDPEYLTSVEAAEELAGFDVLVPTLLPVGYELKRVVWADKIVRLLYGPKSSSNNTLNIFMGLITDHQVSPCSECPPGTVEEVQIGRWRGWYSRGIFESAPSTAGQPTPTPTWNADARVWGLTWITDTLWFNMFYFPSSDYGAEMNKETMVKIAESMK